MIAQQTEQIADLRKQLVALSAGEITAPRPSKRAKRDSMIIFVQWEDWASSRICNILQVIYKNKRGGGESRHSQLGSCNKFTVLKVFSNDILLSSDFIKKPKRYLREVTVKIGLKRIDT